MERKTVTSVFMRQKFNHITIRNVAVNILVQWLSLDYDNLDILAKQIICDHGLLCNWCMIHIKMVPTYTDTCSIQHLTKLQRL
jgi:hypothetical protein